MLVRGVDLPGTLLEAQENGSLVVFAGAGVSVPSPSNYPNFNDLAEEVAQGALVRERAPGSSEYREPVDRFLGRLVKHGVPVHEIVRRILSNPASNPNPLHANLLRLFGSAGAVKLITTNFDRHFTSASSSIFKDPFESYFAPALPLGDRFSGLVYLHGSVEKPAERLVLTDADFGRAYLTEGWARRFLQRLFSHYIVLFVGYSHSDPVMNYLARGLPPESDGPRRFALALEDDFERWTFLGVRPIAYPVGTGDGKHSAVGDVCAAWADRAERGVLDQEQKIKEIVELPVSLDPEDLDYVLEALRKESTTRFFTRYARRTDWLRWIENKGHLKRLFLPGSATNVTEGELASWFADRFVCEHSDDALAVVSRNGQFLNATLWRSIAFRLFQQKDPPPTSEIFGRWVPVLLNSVPDGGSHNILDYILKRLRSPEDAPIAALLFDHLTELRVTLKKDVWSEITESESERVSIEITAEGSDYWLRENWHSIFVPGLDYFADPLLWIVTSNLQHGHKLLQCFGRVHERWDQLNSHRNVIENPGSIYNAIDALVDAGRDILNFYIEKIPEKADSIIKMWVSAECRLLKRLAVYGVAKSTHWNANDKLGWLLEKNLLWAFGLKHEVFSLLEDCYAGASSELKIALLAQVSNVPGSDEEDNRKAYQRYNILVWLQKSSPDCLLVKAELDKIAAAYPEFKPREHPDLDVVIGPVTDGDLQSPTTVEEMLSKTPEEQMSFLLSFEENSFIGPSRSGLLSTVQVAIARSFEWSKNLANALETRVLWDSDLWRCIVDGWNSRDLSDSEWQFTLNYLSDKHQILKTIGYHVAVFLENGIKKPKNAIPDNCFLLAFEVSEKLWAAITSVPQVKREKSDDWLQLAINDPSGILAGFWLHLISRLRIQSGDSWKGIPAQYKPLFESILRDDLNAGSELARVVFASQLHFFFSSDQPWAQQNILPLLDSSANVRRAIQCWHGYLYWGRWSDDLLPNLLPLYEKLYPTIGAETEDTQKRFSEQLAAIACFGSINPLQDGWLKRFLQSVGAKQREEWAGDVRMMLKQLKEPAKRKAWDSWLREYWQSRIDGKPTPLSAVEAGEMAEWSLDLEPVFPQVVEMICSGPQMELQRSFLYYDLADTELPEQHPHSVARLFLFLLQKSTAPIYDFDRIDAVFEKIAKSDVDTEVLLGICNELAKLGYAGASRLRALIRKRLD